MVNDFVLEVEELRAVAAFSVECASLSLEIYERAHPGDLRPREAIAAARKFAEDGQRTKAIRDAAWAAMRAARESGTDAAT